MKRCYDGVERRNEGRRSVMTVWESVMGVRLVMRMWESDMKV